MKSSMFEHIIHLTQLHINFGATEIGITVGLVRLLFKHACPMRLYSRPALTPESTPAHMAERKHARRARSCGRNLHFLP